jgi:hypothetical protein
LAVGASLMAARAVLRPAAALAVEAVVVLKAAFPAVEGIIDDD